MPKTYAFESQDSILDGTNSDISIPAIFLSLPKMVTQKKKQQFNNSID